jgi:tetratricopeptide (TPR) repeat protein
MVKKDLKHIRKTRAWKSASFSYDMIFAELQMPIFGETPTAEQVDTSMEGILKECPDYYPAILQRGQYFMCIGEEEKAIKSYDRGFRIMFEIIKGKELEDMVTSITDGFEEKLRYDLACRYLKKLIKLYPRKALYYDYLASDIAQSINADIQKAIATQEKALELEPHNANFLSNLGWIHLAAGNLDDAGITLKKALEIKPDYKFAKGNMEVHTYLKENNGGNYFGYNIRSIDRDKLEQLEDEEKYEDLDTLVADYNGSRMAAYKKVLLEEGKFLPHQIANLASTLSPFFSFADGVLNEGMFLYDDLSNIYLNFKPIMHKFIFKHKDIDNKILDDIYSSLISFYGFLTKYKLLDRSYYREFVTEIRGMKSELKKKMNRYNKIRHDYTISEEEKDNIRSELFEGDHELPFI